MLKISDVIFNDNDMTLWHAKHDPAVMLAGKMANDIKNETERSSTVSDG